METDEIETSVELQSSFWIVSIVGSSVIMTLKRS